MTTEAIQRYTPECCVCLEGAGHMEMDSDGLWVSYDDHIADKEAALAAANQRIAELERESTNATIARALDERDEARAEVHRLQGERDELQRRLTSAEKLITMLGTLT